MQALNINTHKTHLTSILIDFYKDSELGKSLGFKGGTATMLFYGLPRFSVDLDFDLTDNFSQNSKECENLLEKITLLLKSKYIIKDQSTKFNTLFWAVSYGEGLRQIKVEISTRKQPFNNYDMKPFYGVTIKLSQIRDMIAHKMTTITDRKTLATRDLFDTHYFLSSQYATDINYKIIKKKTDKDPETFYKDLLVFLKDLKRANLLQGLGELVDEKQKYWIKNNMLKELIGLIERQVDLKSWES